MIRARPEMQVTNREFSLFLWQNPQFMRRNIRLKSNYLEAWGDNLTVDPAKADEWVQAPSEALFLYNTWERLLSHYYYSRSIPQREFVAFLKADPQWHPKYWNEATDRYKELVAWTEEGIKMGDLNEVSHSELPVIVRQAFQGWKNFTKESEAINHLKPTYGQLQTFIEVYPNFRRSLWINLVKSTRPDYLKPVQIDEKEVVPDAQMSALLKIALFNYLASTRQNPSS